MTGPTIGEALRHAAFDNTLTVEQARAVATILGALEVIDGGGSEISAEQKGALLDAVIATYRAELGRLDRVYGTRLGAAAARRRADVAARRAAEPNAVEQASNVARLRPDPGPDGPA